MKTLGIIGAGLSGLSCSYQLIKEQANIQIRIYEKSRGIAGRASTRRLNGFSFDHGANYMSLDGLNDYQTKIVKDILDDVDVKQERQYIKEQIHRLHGNDSIDEQGRISEKITFPNGINYLGKLLNQYNTKHSQCGYQITQQTLVTHLEQLEDQKWNLFSGDKLILNSDQVLFSAPAPQVFEIIKKSHFLNPQNQQHILQTLQMSQYYSQITIAMALKDKLSYPFYALVNLDKQNNVSWMSLEDKKIGHVPSNRSMIIVQMSPDWSISNWDQQQEYITSTALERVKAILKNPDISLDFSNIQKWKYSLPKQKANKEDLLQYSSIGLFFSGDSYSDKGRVGVALHSGYETASEILQQSKL